MSEMDRPMHLSSRTLCSMLLAAVALLAPVPGASADDGVIEINQARALAGGVTPGDSAGFPVTLSQAGSYRLTGNLIAPDANTSVIVVGTHAVTIDLGGFEIRGPGTCLDNNTTPGCIVAGSGTGIHANGNRSLTVRNGTVRGHGAMGIFLYFFGRVENVNVYGNGTYGIFCSAYCTIEGNGVRANQSIGIFISTGGIVRNNLVSYNGTASTPQVGIDADTGLVEHNVVESNQGVGIAAASGCRVHANEVRSNTGDGIRAGSGCVIEGNTITSNGGHGIVAGAGSTLTGNSVYQNTGLGFSLGSGSGYGDNVLNANNGGAETQIEGTSGAVIHTLGTNVCQYDTTCP